MRFRIDLEYDGAEFAGWQVQPDLRTVQGVVAEAVASLVGHPVRIDVGGRTDAGVHARQQVVAFHTEAERTPEQIRDGLNAWLPDDVACVRALWVPDDFNPRTWVNGKTYRYRFRDAPGRSPLRRGRVWQVKSRLDEAAMHEAALHIVGTHDFSAFRAAGCQATHPVRTLLQASVGRHDDEVHFEVRGNGFLRHMVRILAGTLWEVGRHKRDAQWFAEILAAGNRDDAGRTAPAHGLVLWAVDVADGPGYPPAGG